MKKNLHFFTASYPYNNAFEGAFIVPEFLYTSQDFEHIYVYTLKTPGKVTFELPSNVSIVSLNFNENNNITFATKVKLIFIVFSELIKHKEYRSFSVFNFLYSQLKQYYTKGQSVLPSLLKNLKKEDLLYTFWFAEWNCILSLLKKEHSISNTLISKRMDLTYIMNVIHWVKFLLENFN